MDLGQTHSPHNAAVDCNSTQCDSRGFSTLEIHLECSSAAVHKDSVPSYPSRGITVNSQAIGVFVAYA